MIIEKKRKDSGNMDNNNQENNIKDTINEVLSNVKEGTQNITERLNETFNEIKDESDEYTEDEIKNGTLMGVLSYLLPFIPFLIEKENRFVIYHAKQGMNLFILAIICGVIGRVGGIIPLIGWLVTVAISLLGVVFALLCLWGILNVFNGKAKELPIVNKIQFIK